MPKVAILYSNPAPLVDALQSKLSWCQIDLFNDADFDINLYDHIISAGYKKELNFNVLTSNLSLLPAFDEKEPVKAAFEAGVKVTGVSVYYTKPRRIIAQYPIFIYNDAHYDELVHELEYIEQTLFPLVAEKIIKNEAFETQALMNGGNCFHCSGCNNCK